VVYSNQGGLGWETALEQGRRGRRQHAGALRQRFQDGQPEALVQRQVKEQLTVSKECTQRRVVSVAHQVDIVPMGLCRNVSKKDSIDQPCHPAKTRRERSVLLCGSA